MCADRHAKPGGYHTLSEMDACHAAHENVPIDRRSHHKQLSWLSKLERQKAERRARETYWHKTFPDRRLADQPCLRYG